MALSAKTPFIDFALLKEQVGIEQVLTMLGVADLVRHGAQLRGHCPICKSDNQRAFVVTPGKGFYCFACRSGGDAIKLAASVNRISQQQAAFAIARHFGLPSSPDPGNSSARGNGTLSGNGSGNSSPSLKQRGTPEPLRPLDYLETEFEGMEALEVTSEMLAAFQAGYAPKGILRGRLAIPVYARGTLIAYSGRRIRDDGNPLLTFPANFDPSSVLFNADRVSGPPLYVTRDPLAIIRAAANGVDNVVAFLADITPQGLKLLIELMDEKEIPSVELF